MGGAWQSAVCTLRWEGQIAIPCFAGTGAKEVRDEEKNPASQSLEPSLTGEGACSLRDHQHLGEFGGWTEAQPYIDKTAQAQLKLAMTLGSSLRAPILSRVLTYGHRRGVAVCSLYLQMGKADRHILLRGHRRNRSSR